MILASFHMPRTNGLGPVVASSAMAAHITTVQLGTQRAGKTTWG